MDWEFDQALDGNIALTGELDLNHGRNGPARRPRQPLVLGSMLAGIFVGLLLLALRSLLADSANLPADSPCPAATAASRDCRST